jgi:hypothetical protein
MVQVAAFRGADGVALVLLMLFALWGALRGPLRQVISLSLLLAALHLAGRLAPGLEPTVAKVTPLDGDGRAAAAWFAALFGMLVVGAILLAFLLPRVPPRRPGRAGTAAGAALGAAKGAIVLVVVAYGILAAGGGGTPALARGTGSWRPGPSFVQRVRGSVSARVLERGGTALGDLLDAPDWMRVRLAEVNRSLRAGDEAGGGRRPRQRRDRP